MLQLCSETVYPPEPHSEFRYVEHNTFLHTFVLRNPHLGTCNRENKEIPASASKTSCPTSNNLFSIKEKHTNGEGSWFHNQARKWNHFWNQKMWRTQQSPTGLCSSEKPGRIISRFQKRTINTKDLISAYSVLLYDLHSCFKLLVWNWKHCAIRWLTNEKSVRTAELPRLMAWAYSSSDAKIKVEVT